MGLDRFHKTPCGFCFVEYGKHLDALYAIRYLNQTKLDDRVIKVDLDPGFKEGRQYGRGASGGQVQDEFRYNYDPGRGGYGKRWDNAAMANDGEVGDNAVNYGAPLERRDEEERQLDEHQQVQGQSQGQDQPQEQPQDQPQDQPQEDPQEV